MKSLVNRILLVLVLICTLSVTNVSIVNAEQISNDKESIWIKLIKLDEKISNAWDKISPVKEFVDEYGYLAEPMDKEESIIYKILEFFGVDMRDMFFDNVHNSPDAMEYIEDLDKTIVSVTNGTLASAGVDKNFFMNWLTGMFKGMVDNKNTGGSSATQEDIIDICPVGNAPKVEKPNIYFYDFNGELSVTFEKPYYLLETIPLYGDGWNITVFPDGTLKDENGISYEYLFYEVSTQKFYYQTEYGFALPSDCRLECFNTLLDGYGFTSEEKTDFIEYWSEELELGVDYIMYPQYTEIVDNAYPITVSPQPDTSIRIWFVFKEDKGQDFIQEEVVPLKRVGKTMFEWGGMIFN